MVWDLKLSVKQVSVEKKKTPKFPSRERNHAVRRRCVENKNDLISDTVSLSAMSDNLHDKKIFGDCGKLGCQECLIRSYSL